MWRVVIAGDDDVATEHHLEAATEGWFWEPATGGTLWIKVPPGEQRVVIGLE